MVFLNSRIWIFGFLNSFYVLIFPFLWSNFHPDFPLILLNIFVIATVIFTYKFPPFPPFLIKKGTLIQCEWYSEFVSVVHIAKIKTKVLNCIYILVINYVLNLFSFMQWFLKIKKWSPLYHLHLGNLVSIKIYPLFKLQLISLLLQLETPSFTSVVYGNSSLTLNIFALNYS